MSAEHFTRNEEAPGSRPGLRAITIEVPIEVPADVLAEYECVAAERGEADVEMIIGIDVQSVTAAHFDAIMSAVEDRS